MVMREFIDEVLDLQSEWTSANTPAMERRGGIVRDKMPGWLRGHREALASALGIPIQDLGIEGSDGKGRKAQVPWVRIHSTADSPRPTVGWYVVYLFSGDGQRCYLTLMQGSMNNDGRELSPKPREVLLGNTAWARSVLGDSALESHLTTRIHLEARRSKEAPAYELGTVCAMEYGFRAAPADEELLNDLREMLQLAARLKGEPYASGDVGRRPNEPAMTSTPNNPDSRTSGSEANPSSSHADRTQLLAEGLADVIRASADPNDYGKLLSLVRAALAHSIHG